MAKTIKCVSFDPSVRNFGMVLLDLDVEERTFKVLDMMLIETAKETGKKVRQNSDDLRRGQTINKGIISFSKGARLAFSEIPSGAQSARAAFTLGMTTGILCCLSIPLIQVMPAETKLASVGSKTASKAEMIEWAMENYPDAPWIMKKVKGVLQPVAKNEHLADGIAVGEAGVLTDEFDRLVATMLAVAA